MGTIGKTIKCSPRQPEEQNSEFQNAFATEIFQEWTAKLDMVHITQQLDEIHGHIHTLTRHAKKDFGAAKAVWRLRLWTLLKRIASVEEVLLTYPQFTTWSEEQIRHRFIPITERISILDKQI